MACFALVMACGIRVSAQTVVINEVSNGPSGNMEYMELVVVPDTPTEPCAPPPCLDLRYWVIDDNNGYHGAGGVAQGAARFANNALWSCVPVGTIIAVYNGAEPNPSLPANDVSLMDGNCSIVVSTTDLSYFEFTNVTPAAGLCADPGGWGVDPSPTWVGNLAFANSGDCARVADPGGCEVFSFCYGNTTQNATVAIAGQGADKVWYFSGGDPNDASNWLTGCAGDIGNCGGDDQTPGTANNAANAAWLSSFNTACNAVVLVPLEATATSEPACGCTGTASAVAQGSTTPYGYVWYDDLWSPIGQATSTATALCSGSYRVIVTSAAGCMDTAYVDVADVVPPDAGSNAELTLCRTDPVVDLFEVLGGTPDADGVWIPALSGGSLFDPSLDDAGVYSYTVVGTFPCADATASVTVTTIEVPVLDVTVTDPTCSGSTDGSILIEPTPAGIYTYTWTGALPSTAFQQDLPGGTWSVAVTDPDGCTANATATLASPTALGLVTSSTPTACSSSTGEACAQVSGGTGAISYSWNDPLSQTTSCAIGLASGTYTVAVSDVNGCGTVGEVIVMNEDPPISVTTTVVPVDCAGAATGAVTLLIQAEENYTVQWTGPEGFAAEGSTINELHAGHYAYSVTTLSDCAVQGDALVDEPPLLVLESSATAATCAGLCDGTLLAEVTGGTAPWQFTVDGEPQPIGVQLEHCAGLALLQVVDAAGCSLSSDLLIEEGAAQVVASVDGPNAVCLSEEAFGLTGSPLGGVWSGIGVVEPVLGVFDPEVAGTGIHIIQYTPDGACAVAAGFAITVEAIPEASFIDPYASGDQVVTSTSSGASAYQWSLNGFVVGSGSQFLLAEELFGPEGTVHELCLVAMSTAGCADTACASISAPASFRVYVPNAFTPNGDGINDTFRPLLAGVLPKHYALTIFDRWGSAVFSTDRPGAAWDGTLAGSDFPIGVFPWRLEWGDTDGSQVLQGHVTLMR